MSRGEALPRRPRAKPCLIKSEPTVQQGRVGSEVGLGLVGGVVLTALLVVLCDGGQALQLLVFLLKVSSSSDHTHAFRITQGVQKEEFDRVCLYSREEATQRSVNADDSSLLRRLTRKTIPE